MWSNFHTHSTYCDGKSSLEDMVASAISKNMISLGFSSHAPLPFGSLWCMKEDKLDSYLNEISHLKEKNTSIQIYNGLEVDYIPSKIGPDDFKHLLDYTIGSVHFVESFADGKGWEIDGTHSTFKEGYEQIFHNDIRAVVGRYFEITQEMIYRSTPTIIGHLDKIKIQNTYHPFFDESENWYREELKKTVSLIKDSGAILEVNTRGVYQKKSSTVYPSPWILELAHEQNIPITISSDAHHANDLINLFPETAELLYSIGFRTISVLLDGKWVLQPIIPVF